MNKKKFQVVKRWILELVWVKDKVIQMLLIKLNMRNNFQEKWKINNNSKVKIKINKMEIKIQIKWKWKMILEVKINNRMIKIMKKRIHKKIQIKIWKT